MICLDLSPARSEQCGASGRFMAADDVAPCFDLHCDLRYLGVPNAWV